MPTTIDELSERVSALESLIKVALPNAVYGTQGGDALAGTPGNDIFLTLAGSDVITPNGGVDRVVVGSGPKTYQLCPGWGQLTVDTWTHGQDKIVLSHSGALRAANVAGNHATADFVLSYGTNSLTVKGGQTTVTASDIVLPQYPQAPMFPIRGFSHVGFGWGSLSLPISPILLHKQRRVGASWTRILPLWTMQTRASNSVEPSNGHGGIGGNSHSDAEVVAAIRAAKRLGLRVCLAPGILVLNEAGVAPAAFDPSDRAAWFASYTAFQKHYAAIAQAEGVDIYSIGQEYKLLSVGTESARWQAVAAAVRGLYTGLISYSTANFDDASGVWPHVDRIGIDAYFSLSNNVPEHDPARLYAAWQPLFQKMQGLSVQWGKKLWISEIGYQSQTDCARSPWGAQSGVADAVAQDKAYDAFLAASNNFTSPTWYDGHLLWAEGPSRGDIARDYTMFGKPAMDRLIAWWGWMSPQ